MKGFIAFVTVLFVMPLAHAVTIVALKPSLNGQLFIAVTGIIVSALTIYLTKFIKSPAWETFTGMIAGVLLWACLVEIGVKAGAELMEIKESKAMEFSLAIFIPLLLYFIFNENIKCNLFISLRKVLNISRETPREISVDHWGPRVAFKMFAMIWIGHLVLFFAFDEDFFGPHGLFCKVLFFLCLIGGTFLFNRLLKAEKIDFAFRYAIPTVIVVWSCVETLVKWKVFSEPWITLNPVFMTIVVVAFTVTLFLIVRIGKKKRVGG